MKDVTSWLYSIAGLASVGYGVYEVDAAWLYILVGVVALIVVGVVRAPSPTDGGES